MPGASRFPARARLGALFSLLVLLGLLAVGSPASAQPRDWHDGGSADGQPGSGDGSTPVDDGSASNEPDTGWQDDPAPGADASTPWSPPQPDAQPDLTPPGDPALPLPAGPAKPAVPPAPAVPVLPPVPVPTSLTIRGKVAYVRADGKAAIPRGAPKQVRVLIAAANQIVGKPYKWGGGHAKLFDKGYDCSGSVGYALIRTGLLVSPVVSGQLARWSAQGPGRWVTVYANAGHVYMEVAGLRFDTSPVADPTGRSGVRWRPVIGRRAGFHARHPAGL